MESTPFTPVPLRSRRDGWTAERQQAFVAALAEGRSPGTAARAVGMSRQTAYAFRGRAGAEGFADAWDAAIEAARRTRVAARPPRPTLWERAVTGIATPVFYGGRQVGEVRRYDHRPVFDALRREALRANRNGSPHLAHNSPERARDRA